MKKAILYLSLFLAFMTTGCQFNANDTALSAPEQQEQQPASRQEGKIMTDKVIWQQGMIKHIRLEGGFFGIVTPTGERYLPLNLPKTFHQDGAMVKFIGAPKKDVMTIQQWGTPFEIKDIKLVKPGKSG